MVGADEKRRAVEGARARVVPVLQRLLGFDTEIADHQDPPREEQALVEWAAGFLRQLGAEVEVFEPDPSVFENHPMSPPRQTFAGRPILWGVLKGREGAKGPSLLFNGHYDTVPAAPLESWNYSHLGHDIVDGKVYGRGSCDMKGGIAAAMAAVAGLVESGIQPSGDVLFNFVPFEEVNGMGTVATMLAGKRADAAICSEPVNLLPLSPCRGIMHLELEVQGRSAHADLPQRHHSEGGGVNAIDKLVDLIGGLRRLNEQWQTDPAKQHPLLSPPAILPTVIEGGTFWNSWPDSAVASFDIAFMPGEADAAGYGSRVHAEVEQFVANLAANDSWLAQHPPVFRWMYEVPPGEIDPRDPFVELVVAASGQPALGGVDTWADHVTLIRDGGIPSVLLGPGDGDSQAHTVDECIEIESLQKCVEIYIEIIAAWGDGVPSGGPGR